MKTYMLLNFQVHSNSQDRVWKITFSLFVYLAHIVTVYTGRKYMRGGDLLTATGFRDTYKTCRPTSKVAFLKLHKVRKNQICQGMKFL